MHSEAPGTELPENGACRELSAWEREQLLGHTVGGRQSTRNIGAQETDAAASRLYTTLPFIQAQIMAQIMAMILAPLIQAVSIQAVSIQVSDGRPAISVAGRIFGLCDSALAYHVTQEKTSRMLPYQNDRSDRFWRTSKPHGWSLCRIRARSQRCCANGAHGKPDTTEHLFELVYPHLRQIACPSRRVWSTSFSSS